MYYSLYITYRFLIYYSLVRRMWRSKFVPETIFRRCIRLKRMPRTCWTIQTHSYGLNWARRPTFQELNSLSLVRLLKSSTLGPGLTRFHQPLSYHYKLNWALISVDLISLPILFAIEHQFVLSLTIRLNNLVLIVGAYLTMYFRLRPRTKIFLTCKRIRGPC